MIKFFKEIDKSLPVLSISNVLTLLQEPFDSVGVATNTYNKHYNNPDSEYYKMEVKDILEVWENKGKESCKYGSLLDNYIGNILTGTNDSLELWKLDNNYDYDNRLHSLCDSFDNFYKVFTASGDIEFIDREKTIYLKCDGFYIKGRFDALFRNKRLNRWIIIDWKSSGNIDKVTTKWTKNLLGPASCLPALNYYTYTLQTHFYKKALLESEYLPEGTTENDIDVFIISLPGKQINESNYEICREAFKYDSELMNRIFLFAYRKNLLLNKQNNNNETIK